MYPLLKHHQKLPTETDQHSFKQCNDAALRNLLCSRHSEGWTQTRLTNTGHLAYLLAFRPCRSSWSWFRPFSFSFLRGRSVLAAFRFSGDGFSKPADSRGLPDREVDVRAFEALEVLTERGERGERSRDALEDV